MDFETIKSGDFPLYGYLLMLVLDAVLYYMLAIYLDNIVPGKRIQVFKMQENFKLLKMHCIQFFVVLTLNSICINNI